MIDGIRAPYLFEGPLQEAVHSISDVERDLAQSLQQTQSPPTSPTLSESQKQRLREIQRELVQMTADLPIGVSGGEQALVHIDVPHMDPYGYGYDGHVFLSRLTEYFYCISE